MMGSSTGWATRPGPSSSCASHFTRQLGTSSESPERSQVIPSSSRETEPEKYKSCWPLKREGSAFDGRRRLWPLVNARCLDALTTLGVIGGGVPAVLEEL